MARNLLTDRQVKSAKPKAKPYRLFDGEGLALWISSSGVKSWQLRYRLDTREQTATLGKVEQVSLAEARTKADELRKLVHQGEQLTLHKKMQRAQRRVDAAVTFASYSAAWAESEAKAQKWTAQYKAEVEASLRNHLSDLDALPMTKLTASILAPVLKAAQARAPHMLEKVRRRLRAILDDATLDGILAGNPLPAHRRRSHKGEPRHYPAVTALEPLGAILRAAMASDPCKGIQRAHTLLAFTVQRVGEVVPAAWQEFDLEAATWSIPRARMKRKDPQRGPHVIPLPSALLDTLREWRRIDGNLATGYVCPAPRDSARPITPEAIEKHYRNALGLAGTHSPHSWRSAFSTICREAGKESDVIEAQLDHVIGNKVASAYDRAHRLDLRRELVQWYEDRLIAARDGAEVIKLKLGERRKA